MLSINYEFEAHNGSYSNNVWFFTITLPKGRFFNQQITLFVGSFSKVFHTLSAKTSKSFLK